MRILILVAALLVTGCASIPKNNIPETPAPVQPEEIISKIHTMSLREKIGQLFMIVPEDLDLTLTQEQIDREKVPASTAISKEMKNVFNNYPAGGVILFKKNLENPKQLEKLLNEMESVSEIPLFIATDEEGGRVARLARLESFGTPQIPAALKTESEEEAFERSLTIGQYLKKYGINVDFAPDADVWTNPHNTVIGDRAFSTDPETAASYVAKSVEGFHQAGVLTAIKHFPGHGDTVADSHTGTAKSFKTWEQLKKCEMIPFARGIEAGTDMVMLAHIKTPRATKDNLPSSLSHEWITKRLRNQMGFDGIVITDALGMKAVSDLFSPGKAALKAIDAGCDILLMSPDYTKVFDHIENSVKSGRISEKRIDESVTRILSAKERMNGSRNSD